MSPRQFGKADESVGWPNLPCCPHRHKVSVPCPPTGVWLVLAFCHRCKPPDGYCGPHGGRRRLEAVPDDVSLVLPDVPAQAEHLRRYEGGEG